MNGSASSSVTKIARIFGTNTSVCSWICVSAWNSDTTTPTTRPTTISGDDTMTIVQIASRATSSVSAPVMISIPSGPVNSSIHPGMTVFQKSDRHLHDVFVGLNDLVAHRHQRRHLDIGLG